MSNDMTIEICKDFCRDGNWAIAGTESYGECFCGNQVSPMNQIPASKCNRVCNGSSDEICGGHYAMILHYL